MLREGDLQVGGPRAGKRDPQGPPPAIPETLHGPPEAPNSLSPLPLLLGPQPDWWGKRGDSHPHEGLGASGGGTRRRKGLCTEAEVLDREQRVALRLTAKAPET